jgi:hypothetical protein
LFLEGTGGTALIVGALSAAEAAALRSFGYEVSVAAVGDDPICVRSEGYDLVVCAGAFDPRRARRWFDAARGEILLALDPAPLRGPREVLSSAGIPASRELAFWPSAAHATELFVPGRDWPRPCPEAALRARAAKALRRFARPASAALGSHARRSDGSSRIERVLSALSQRLGEPCPAPELVFASCGATIEVHTACPALDAADPRGRWVLHLGTQSGESDALQRGAGLQHRALELDARAAVPRPLAFGVFEGLSLHCERRLPGWPADRRAISSADAGRWQDQASSFLAGLRVPGAAPIAASDIASRCRTWRELAREQLRSTSAASRCVERLAVEASSTLAGLALPAVLAHGDLRPRHLLVDSSRQVRGWIHWSLGEAEGLPGLDWIHLHLHLEAQRRRETLGAALQRLLAAEQVDLPEHAALWRYASALGLSRSTLLAIARLHPLYLASIAGRFSHPPSPGWLAAQLGPLAGSS